MIYLRKPVNVLFQQPPNYILRIYEVFILKKFSVEQIRESLRENRTSHLHLLMRFLLCFKFSFGTFIFNLENHFLISRRWNISSVEKQFFEKAVVCNFRKLYGNNWCWKNFFKRKFLEGISTRVGILRNSSLEVPKIHKKKSPCKVYRPFLYSILIQILLFCMFHENL